MSVCMQAWKAVTNLKQVGKVVHIYEVRILGEAIQGRRQQREPLLSTAWCQLIPCTDRQNKDSTDIEVMIMMMMPAMTTQQK